MRACCKIFEESFHFRPVSAIVVGDLGCAKAYFEPWGHVRGVRRLEGCLATKTDDDAAERDLKSVARPGDANQNRGGSNNPAGENDDTS